MDLTKKIFFDNDKIVENAEVKVTYCGELYENNSEEVHIHFGYGLLWTDVAEQAMTKTDTGFETTINIPGTDLFNCCFRNEANEWDNNDGHNYSFVVEKNELAIVKKAEELPARRLSRSYILGKKLKILFYKVITYIPQLFGSTYKKKDGDVVPQ